MTDSERKIVAAVARGAVETLPGRIMRVHPGGPHRPYRVTLTADGDVCDPRCTAAQHGRSCWHIAAARLQVQAETEGVV